MSTVVKIIKQNDLDECDSNNCSLLINDVVAVSGDSVYSGDVLKIQPTIDTIKIITAKYSYSNPIVGGTSKTNFFVSDDGTSAILTVTTNNLSNDYELSITNEVVILPVVKSISQNDLDECNSNNCSLLINDVVAVSGDSVYSGDVLKIQPTIDTIKIITANYVYSNPITGDVTRIFTVSDDGTSAILTVTTNNLSNDYELSITNKVVESEVTANNLIYIVDSDNIDALNSQRFVSNSSTEVLVDYGNYILNLIQIPFTVPDNYIGGTSEIVLGNLTTNITAQELSSDHIVFDLGEIFIPEDNNNLLDFTNTEIKLHLPYAPITDIPLDYAINCTISIKYIIDVYTGVTIINLTSTNFENVSTVFSSNNVDLGINIPFISSGNFGQIDNNNLELGGDNGLRTPYIEILRNNSELLNSDFTVPIKDYGTLSGLSGYFEIKEINLSGIKYKDEIVSLKNILQNGVFING